MDRKDSGSSKKWDGDGPRGPRRGPYGGVSHGPPLASTMLEGLTTVELSKFETYDGDEDHLAHRLLLEPSNYSSIESKLIFVALAGVRDPPRKEVHQVIKDSRAAEIRVMLITGNYKNTPEAICHEIGLFGHEDTGMKSLTGKEFM
ncbi:hypothetical protein L1049_000982 [Liquidambar formosana]|uniref:Uncharacterized protein n=1 Tax=Liquidambar formosana TaxID=63359 RepID=A0AAP0NBL0_LIQFO